MPRLPARRGLHRHAGVRLRSRYPFRLLVKDRFLALPASLLVYPALVPVAGAIPAARLEGQDRPARGAGRGPDVASVRAYREHDEARDIHWRRSASVGALMVRERERESRSVMTLVLDNRGPGEAQDPSWAAGFERAIAEAASLAEHLGRRDFAVQVVTASGASPRVAPGDPLDPLFRFLALLPAAPSDAPAPNAPSGAHVVAVGRIDPAEVAA
jgi:uncharacterized protein (DUF58 family)